MESPANVWVVKDALEQGTSCLAAKVGLQNFDAGRLVDVVNWGAREAAVTGRLAEACESTKDFHEHGGTTRGLGTSGHGLTRLWPAGSRCKHFLCSGRLDRGGSGSLIKCGARPHWAVSHSFLLAGQDAAPWSLLPQTMQRCRPLSHSLTWAGRSPPQPGILGFLALPHGDCWEEP